MKDYKETITKRRGIKQWICHISYREEITPGLYRTIEHNIYASDKQAVEDKAKEYKLKHDINET